MKKYAVLPAVNKGAFWERLCHLYMKTGDYLDMEQLEGRTLKYAKVFLSDKERQYTRLLDSQLWTEYLSDAVCVISGQAPLDGSKITLMLITSDEEDRLVLPGMIMEMEKSGDFTEDKRKESRAGKTVGKDLYDAAAGCINAFASRPVHELIQPEEPVAAGRRYPSGNVYARGFAVTGAAGQDIFVGVSGGDGCYGDNGFDDDIKKLAGRLLGTIGMMLKDKGAAMNDIDCFTVYLSDFSDYRETDGFMGMVFPSVPRVMVKAGPINGGCTMGIECSVAGRK